MTSIKLTVTGAQIWASVTGVLTSGMVGIPITIEYDEAWDGLTKNLMCRCSPWGSDDGEIRTRLNVGEASTVAHEVMQQGMYLYLGVEGFRADGTLVIPTTWARCGKIEYGANTCDDPSMDPELTIWNQLQTEMEETKKYVLTPEQAVNIQAYAQEARQAAEEAKQAAKHGLYYIPTVSQPTDDTLRFAFTPSITGAPTPKPVTVVLPDDEDSAQNLDYSAATNKPSINGVTLEGNKTAEQLGIGQPTDEQVGNAVNDYLTEHPVAAGATPEQVAQLEFATNTDAALFATLETGSLYELDLSKFGWYDGVYLHWNTTGLSWGRNMTKAGHHYLNSGWIELRKGDILITNADTDVKAGANHYLSCLVQKKASQLAAYNDGGNTMVMQGRGAYDGLYRTYTATDDVEYLRVAYQYDVDYDVHFYVARARTENAVPFELYGGYLKPATGEAVIVSETNWGVTGYNYSAVSSLMTISAPGKFLLVDNVRLHDDRGGYCWCRYAEDGTMTYGMLWNRGNKGHYIIPLFDETERIRFSCHLTDTPYQYITAQLVDAEYLIQHGYATKLAGKKMVGFGDSYIYGHNQGEWRTALYRIAEEHQMKYTAFGHNGWGICRGPLTPTTLADVITEELSGLDTDYIVVWAGRNDYSSQAPIGTNDDMADMSVNYLQRTFKGSLNYICKFLVENYPGKKIAFFTPWYFPSTLTDGETHKPVEYIDAIKEICGIWGIPVLDCARDCGIHVKSEVFRSRYFLSADDVSHLNWDGACLFADGPADDWLMLL